MFEDVSDRLGHAHHENDFNDSRFNRFCQETQPVRTGVACMILMETAMRRGDRGRKDGELNVYTNNGSGHFKAAALEAGKLAGDAAVWLPAVV